LGGRGRRICEFKASLAYRVSSRTGRAIQRNPVSKKKKQKEKKRKKILCGKLQNSGIPLFPTLYSNTRIIDFYAIQTIHGLQELRSPICKSCLAICQLKKKNFPFFFLKKGTQAVVV
jgi:hypothetical protein